MNWERHIAAFIMMALCLYWLVRVGLLMWDSWKNPMKYYHLRESCRWGQECPQHRQQGGMVDLGGYW